MVKSLFLLLSWACFLALRSLGNKGDWCIATVYSNISLQNCLFFSDILLHLTCSSLNTSARTLKIFRVNFVAINLESRFLPLAEKACGALRNQYSPLSYSKE